MISGIEFQRPAVDSFPFSNSRSVTYLSEGRRDNGTGTWITCHSLVRVYVHPPAAVNVDSLSPGKRHRKEGIICSSRTSGGAGSDECEIPVPVTV